MHVLPVHQFEAFPSIIKLRVNNYSLLGDYRGVATWATAMTNPTPKSVEHPVDIAL